MKDQYAASDAQKERYYHASVEERLATRNINYVAVRTTKVFCRAGCAARQPKFENCEFFRTAEQSLLAGFRPCKRCQPLSHRTLVSEPVRQIVEAVEADPHRLWRSSDFLGLNQEAEAAAREFQQQFDITLLTYADARRQGPA